MDSSNRNRKLHYEGDVVMWQGGANRIQADSVDLDREKKILAADGHVVTNLWEEPKGPKKKGAAPVLTEVRAAHLVYTEADRQAVYTGGASLKRPSLEVKSRQIRAFLSAGGGDSRLEKAFADGAVEIFQGSPSGNSYRGSGEHSEYYMDEPRVVLRGGAPRMVNNKGIVSNAPGGFTYYPNDDRLVINGSEKQPATTTVPRKK
jgi:lipopolysaccharide export system protein LptA